MAKDLKGDYTTFDWMKVRNENYRCPKCKGSNILFKIWESSDGGYEDHHYRCECGNEWWVESSDA